MMSDSRELIERMKTSEFTWDMRLEAIGVIEQQAQEIADKDKEIECHILARKRDKARIAELEEGGVHSCSPFCDRTECVLRRRVEERERWIPVSERLPETGKPVFIARHYRNGKRATTRGFYAAKHTLDADNWEDWEGADYDEGTDNYYCPKGWHEDMTSDYCDCFYSIDQVTHWKPITPPKGDV